MRNNDSMPVLEDTFTASLDAVLSSTARLPADVALVRPLADARLLVAQVALAEARRAIEAAASLVAGEIAYRSRRELGYRGLAQREGYRTAEKLVQHTTGSSARDASTLVHIGALVHEAEAARGDGPAAHACEPWLVAVGSAVASGLIGVEAAQAIRSGLGRPTDTVTARQLADAATTLIALSPALHVDRLFARARALRDDLDLEGVALRESELHAGRSIRRVRRSNGLSRYIVDPDLESGALWDEVYDKLTAPRRGGPSFVDPSERAWADAIAADRRTVEQYVHDSITGLLRIAVTAETSESRRIIGSRQPAVRVLVAATALATRTGLGRIEGVDQPVSMATVERIACAEGTVALAFDDDGQALNVGREQRLYTRRQRVALAARDGGCRWTGCDRPPSWCEAHHIQHWKRDVGRTDLADGILLCRHHHMLLHNNGWEIGRDPANRDPGTATAAATTAAAAGYWLIPPPGVDPQRMPRPMPSHSAALRDLLAAEPA
jgi:hypothetical protein